MKRMTVMLMLWACSANDDKTQLDTISEEPAGEPGQPSERAPLRHQSQHRTSSPTAEPTSEPSDECLADAPDTKECHDFIIG